MRRTNKLKGMYALLVAVAACVGITIYASCSADEDYGDYSSRDELFTLADGEMNLRTEPQGTVWFYGDSIDSVGFATKLCQPFNGNQYHVNLYFQWSEGWTGNISQYKSQMYVLASSIHYSSTEESATQISYTENTYDYRIYNIGQSATGEWKPDLKYHVDLTVYGNIYKVHNLYNLEYIGYGSKTFYDIQQYDYEDLGIHIHH